MHPIKLNECNTLNKLKEKSFSVNVNTSVLEEQGMLFGTQGFVKAGFCECLLESLGIERNGKEKKISSST
jgi:hypothetical protein